MSSPTKPSRSLRSRLRNLSTESASWLARAVGLNVAFYRAAYHDVRPLSDGVLLRHWILTGRRESRISSWSRLKRSYQKASIDPATLDPITYFSIHADLASAGVDSFEAACVHFVRRGHDEGRMSRLDLPSFLDSTRHPHLRDRGWTVPAAGRPQLGKRESQAQAIFQDSLENHLISLDAEEFASACFEQYLGYLPELPHFDDLVAKLDVGTFSRAQWLVNLVSTVQDVRARGLNPRTSPAREPTYEDFAAAKINRHSEPIKVMGIEVMTTGEWHYRAFVDEEVRYATATTSHRKSPRNSRVAQKQQDFEPRVSVLCSMYRTGELLIPFLKTLRSQTLFSFTEFILVLVDPNDFEIATCTEFAEMNDNVVLMISENRLGIYEAWNLGVSVARGDYLTNMNVDDVRSPDSIEKQASVLDRFAWADVVYQDVMVSLDSRLVWNNVVKTGARLRMTKSGMTTFASYRNPPHNAPMWRRSLHDELGVFDGSLVSAGDFDFWVRCAAAGKVFFNVPDAHVGYFINPEGISTRKETRGFDEGREIVRRHRDVFVRGPRPEYVDDLTRSFPRPRSERTTLGLIRTLQRMALESSANGVNS